MFDGASLCRRSSANVSVEKLSKLVYGFQILKRPGWKGKRRSEEHTSELQSQSNLVCRLLLEKKNRQCRATDRPDASRAAMSALHDSEPVLLVAAASAMNVLPPLAVSAALLPVILIEQESVLR